VVRLRAEGVGGFDRHRGKLPRALYPNRVDRVPQAPSDADSNAVRVVAPGLAGRLDEVRRGRVEQPRLFKQLTAGFGDRHALTMADEQRDAELFLQLSDVAAQRRLRDVQPFGRSRHAGFFGDGDECAEVAEIHGGRFYTRSVYPFFERCIGQLECGGAAYARLPAQIVCRQPLDIRMTRERTD
jgi:hypothetical protein